MKAIRTAVIILLMAVGSVLALVPQYVNYQGRLTTPAGTPVADGSYSVKFTIYADTTAAWNETQTITTANGLFAVALGTINPINPIIWATGNTSLGITINGGAELSPRTSFLTVPYAQNADRAAGFVDAGGNITSFSPGRSLLIGAGSPQGLVSIQSLSTAADIRSGGTALNAISDGTAGDVTATGAFCQATGTASVSTAVQAYVNIFGPSAGYGVFSEVTGTPDAFLAAIYGYAGQQGNPNVKAGYFQGDVDVVGTLTKAAGSFKIDHPLDPENKYLQHSFVESPDMKNIYDGVVTLDAAGKASITLPDWFQALNADFRYQLTCVGGYAPVYVASEVDGNRFSIAGGKAGLKVSWQVTGIRKDPYARAHRIPVEVPKVGAERGTYLMPELYGKGEDKGVGYTIRAAMAKSRAEAATKKD